MLPRSSLTLEVHYLVGMRFLGHLGRMDLSGWVAGTGDRRWGIKAVVATAEHNGGDARHDWLRLDVEVAIHLVGVPPPDEADAVRIDAAA